MEFNVGQYVIVKPNLNECKNTEHHIITKRMLQLAGEILKIDKVMKRKDGYLLKLEDDSRAIVWHENWVIPIKNETSVIQMFINKSISEHQLRDYVETLKFIKERR